MAAVVEFAYEEFKKEIAERVPGKVLLTKVWGSHSHGCETPESDIDFTAVYKWSRPDSVGLFPPAETIDNKGPD